MILNNVPLATGVSEFSFTTLFFFPFGAWFSVHPHTIKGTVFKYRIPLMFIVILCFICSISFNGEYSISSAIVEGIYILTEVLTTYNIAVRMVKRQMILLIVEHLSTMTFFYVSHYFSEKTYENMLKY